MITCSCGDDTCKSHIRVDGDSFWVEDTSGREILIYLDANRKVALIRELHASLTPQELKQA
jgi:hypothetical protein